MDSLFEDLITAHMARVHPAVRAWLPAERIESNIRSQIGAVYHGAQDAAVACELMSAHPVPGAPLDDYRPRLLGPRDAGADGPLLTRVCFPAPGAGGAPYAEIVGLGSCPSTADEFRAAASAAVAPFRRLGVAEARLFWPAHAAPDLHQLAATSPEVNKQDEPAWIAPSHRLFALPVRTIQALPLPAHAERVRVERAADLGFYELYADYYRRWHAERPDLQTVVRVESPADMRKCLDSALLSLVFVDDRPAGVMASLRADTAAGAHGYRMVEEFLYPDFRGRALAPAVQRRYIDTLDAPTGEAVLGWIHPTNLPSIKTATRVGRLDLGGVFRLRAETTN